jgi:hypothetical protein
VLSPQQIVERTGECWFDAELNRHKGGDAEMEDSQRSPQEHPHAEAGRRGPQLALRVN